MDGLDRRHAHVSAYELQLTSGDLGSSACRRYRETDQTRNSAVRVRRRRSDARTAGKRQWKQSHEDNDR
jgi:hypothetical protein